MRATLRSRWMAAVTFLVAALGWEAPGYADEVLDLTLRTALQGTGSAQRQSLSNPDNLVLQAPSQTLQAELRPDAVINLPHFRLSLKPRVHDGERWVRSGEVERFSKDRPDIFWNQALVSIWWQSLSLTYGLENYQWGPGELISPSNPLTHEQILNQVGLYEVPGQHQLRLNVGLSSNLSFVLEYAPSYAFLKRPEQSRAVLGKLEYRSADGRWYLGATGTCEELRGPGWGGYGQLELTEGFYFYFDSIVRSEDQTYYPNKTLDGWIYRRSGHDDQSFSSNQGLRYSAANGNDLRLEYLHQDPGYNASEWRRVRRSLRETPPAAIPAVAGASFRTGMDLPGSDYAYASLRLPDWPQRDWTLWLRNLTSLSDPSNLSTIGVQWNASDHMQYVGEAHATFGQADRDLTRVYQEFYNLGLLWSL